MSTSANAPLGSAPAGSARASDTPAARTSAYATGGDVAHGFLGLLVVFGTIFLWPVTIVALLVISAWRRRARFFSFRGRLNTALFRICIVTHALYVFVVWAMIAGATEDEGVSALVYWSLVSVLILLPVSVSAAAVGVKRLHDHNRSGWWLLPLYVVPGAILACDYAFNSLPSWFSPLPVLVAVPLLLGAFVWLGCLCGTAGSNPYGPEVVIENNRKKKNAPIVKSPATAPLAKVAPVVTSPEETPPAKPAAVIAATAETSAVGTYAAHAIGARFFSFKGRLDRRSFWVCIVLQIIYGGVVTSAILGVTRYGEGTASTPLFWVLMSVLVFLPVAISATAICAKRLHDLNTSDRWLLLLLVPPLSSFVLLFGLIWLGGWRGTVGPNLYGPDVIADREAKV